jgi:carbon storage regulator
VQAMLVLTRRIGESVVIGKDKMVKLRIISIQGNQVKLGIDAPKHIPIHREEVFDLIKEEEEKSHESADAV